eukprot:UN22909
MNQVDGQMLYQDLDVDMLQNDLNVKKLHINKFKRELEKLRVSNEGATSSPTYINSTNNSSMQIHTFGYGTTHERELLESLAKQHDGMYFSWKMKNPLKKVLQIVWEV